MDEDFVLALQLSQQLNDEEEFRVTTDFKTPIQKPLSIVDESWELIDPAPNIRELFVQFNDIYFQGLLAGCEVKWSKRMTLCAGLCCYEGRGGLCSIKLSEPLLKLRPRSDLINTLLHEMIHALLFVTDNNKDHDGHGAEFHKHMYRINKETGSKITVYHTFHDEVNNYRQHWWRCDGPCVKRPPYYGIVRRAMNRVPSSRDPWFNDHKQKCGGTFIKIKEPEKPVKSKKNKDNNSANNIKESISKESKDKIKKPKEITEWFAKTNNSKNISGDNNDKNLESSLNNSDKLKSNHGDHLKNNAFWNNKTTKDNVKGFGEVTKSDANVYSASSHTASSNIHGFKMSENKKTEIKITTFEGKGFKVESTSTTARESFLKHIENNMTSHTNNIALKRKLDSNDTTESNPKNIKIDVSNVRDKNSKNSLPQNDKNFSNETLSSTSKSGTVYSPINLDDSLIRYGETKGIILVDCPACPAKMPEYKLNEHLDHCLS